MREWLETDCASEECVMIERNLGAMPGSSEFVAEDTASQLFQIAALLVGDEQEAVVLVEQTLARTETDPCADGTLAYAEARSLLVQNALQRMASLSPETFAAPQAQPAEASCIDTDDLGDVGPAGDPFDALLAAAGRAGMRDWLDRLAPALRAIFVLRAVAGQDGEETAESLRQSGAKGAQGWRRDLVGVAYRQALCSLATCLMRYRGAPLPA